MSEMDELRDPVIEQAIESLQLPQGSRGLDVGCGNGHYMLRLAEAIGPAGHVTGLDASQALLDEGARLAAAAGLSERVTFRQGDWSALPFDDASFDWLWSADGVGYAPGNRATQTAELVRVLRPGGLLVILFWSSQALLPGYPLLEARLNATSAGIAPFSSGMAAESHPLRTASWLRAAGLGSVQAETFVRSVFAPLDDTARAALLTLFDMRWTCGEAELSAADRAEFRRLCTPGSPDLILDAPGYCAFFTYTMFTARVQAALE